MVLSQQDIQWPEAGDWPGQREQPQLPDGLVGLTLPGVDGAEQGGGGLHRRKEKKRLHPRPTSRRVKVASRALALALTRRRCQPGRLQVLGRTIEEVLSPALHHGEP